MVQKDPLDYLVWQGNQNKGCAEIQAKSKCLCAWEESLLLRQVKNEWKPQDMALCGV